MILGMVAEGVAEPGTPAENPRWTLCGGQPAPLVRGSSATNHCHAAPAQPTRGYQRDHRRSSLNSVPLSAAYPLDNHFHISVRGRGVRRG